MTNEQHIEALKKSKQLLLDAVNSFESELEYELSVHAASRIQAIDAELEIRELSL